jgi:hypothetical protein
MRTADDKIQEFLYATGTGPMVDTDALNRGDAPIPPPEEAKDDAKRALESLRTLGTLALTSSAFRSILSDAVLVLRDVMADAASATAEAADRAAQKARKIDQDTRPSEDERRRGVDVDPQQLKQKSKEARASQEQRFGQLSFAEVAKKANRQARQYVDEKTPDDAKDEAVERLKQVRACIALAIRDHELTVPY